jgi:hypothetical protein
VRVTHPFHPLAGQEFEFVKRRKNWQLDRVYFYDGRGALVALPGGVDRCGCRGSVRGRVGGAVAVSR